MLDLPRERGKGRRKAKEVGVQSRGRWAEGRERWQGREETWCGREGEREVDEWRVRM